MINVHGQGYYGALAAGAQTVMVSFNSWTNDDSDQRGQAARQQASAQPTSSRTRWASTASSSPTGTASARSPAAPTPAARRRSTPASTSSWCRNDWKAFIANTLAQVERGRDPDGAHRRRGDPDPARQAARRPVRRAEAVGARARRLGRPRCSSQEARAQGRARVARAAQERDSACCRCRELEGARGRQERRLAAEPDRRLDADAGRAPATPTPTSRTARRSSAACGRRWAPRDVTFGETGEGVDPADYDAVIAVIGETPYAEGVGDLGKRSLEAAKLYPERPRRARQRQRQGRAGRDRVRLGPAAVRQQGAQPLRRVRGRLAAGHRGRGRRRPARQGPPPGRGFTGKLSYSWPETPCQTPLNAGDEGYDPLFALGYGLRNGQTATVAAAAGGVPSRAASTAAAAAPRPRTSSCSTARTSRRTRATSARRTTGAAPRSATTRAR